MVKAAPSLPLPAPKAKRQSVAKTNLGTKRIDPETGRKFYDLNKDPIVSPYTGKSYPRSYFDSGEAKVEEEEVEDKEVEAEEEEGVEVVSLEEADDEASGGSEADVEVEDEEDVDLGDDDEDTFLEDEDEDDDVGDIVDVDGEDDEH
jgi:uncharacterized protein (TIGR02300 family)